jgi:hypothetical protein
MSFTKPDRSEYRRQWLESKGPRYRKQEWLKRVYNLTLDEYDSLLERQNNSCAICGESADQFKKGLALDHCHSTGSIRGLLCGTCNRWLIGAVKTPELLRKAAEYLENAATGYLIREEYRENVRRKNREV